MKYIKTHEELNYGNPELDDYIIVNEEVYSILKNKIGHIKNSFPDSHQSTYKCIFDNDIWWINRSDIKYWSKNKEELEQKIVSDKFNI